MDITRGRELQERIGLDALTLLVLFGDSISTEMHERSIRMVGKTWGIPDAETQEWLDAIAKEHSYAESGSLNTCVRKRSYPSISAVWRR